MARTQIKNRKYGRNQIAVRGAVLGQGAQFRLALVAPSAGRFITLLVGCRAWAFGSPSVGGQRSRRLGGTRRLGGSRPPSFRRAQHCDAK